ncbi:hypothetical protein GCM10007938_30320 [Vibrio zhanjiangensis]|uniref:Uncharacterized protein n=1 Tax=Vibrio zhanjiangensis TaxID=1046128 RepID=A0ABQ6F3A1_9VIBR|nr:hypothetical protein [Vibrio zhanjiangensis]GLT19250.1 hypothetical protein GCM10007938_30320 [Vibrio zhanjiangensis]
MSAFTSILLERLVLPLIPYSPDSGSQPRSIHESESSNQQLSSDKTSTISASSKGKATSLGFQFILDFKE